MSRETRNAANRNGHKANVQIQVSNQVGVEPLTGPESIVVEAQGGKPSDYALVKMPILAQNIALIGVGGDGTLVLEIKIGVPPGLLENQLGSSRLLGPNGIPTGALAVLQQAMAPIVPMFVLPVIRAKLVATAQQLLQRQEELAALWEGIIAGHPFGDSPFEPGITERYKLGRLMLTDLEQLADRAADYGLEVPAWITELIAAPAEVQDVAPKAP